MTVMLGAALIGIVGGSSSASAAKGAQQFCAVVSGAGGSAPFAQAATSGQRASELSSAVKKLGKAAPSKRLKSDVATLGAYLAKFGHGQSLADLSSKDAAKLQSALNDFSTYVGANCSSAAASTPTTAATAATGLSGTWSGQYSGANQGTFTLTWTQSGSTLSGTINISEIGAPVNINGTVNGSSITFGTVGTAAVTYSGSVSGSSMSGTYQSPNGNGNWSATKTS
jgi:hypothetical protein